MQSVYHFYQILSKPEFSRHILVKVPPDRISRQYVQQMPSCSMGTDRHDKANSPFSQPSESA
jgi:hypothetical protein